MLSANRITRGGAEVVPVHEVVTRVFRGEVLVVRNCLQSIGSLDALQAASLTGIAGAVGEDVAAAVKRMGFQHFHQAIDVDDLDPIMKSLYAHYLPLTGDLARNVVHGALGVGSAFYYEETVNVRFQVPYDFAARHKARKVLSENWSGKVVPHCPHHDSWYECPANAFNVWMAIGPVLEGNGLAIFTDVFGKRLPHTDNGRMPPNQYFGRPLTVALNAGDALVFHGEHLHSSEINITAETRHVVSLRLTLDEPRFYAPSSARFVYSPPPASASGEASGVSEAPWSESGRSGRGAADQAAPPFDDLSAKFPKPLESSPATVPGSVPEFDPSALRVGEIRPLSRTQCAAKVSDSEIVVFQRHCPHEGADLAGGYLRGKEVVCPWHNLPIDLATGTSPCQTLPKIRVFSRTENV